MLDQVLRPIGLGKVVRYQRHDWSERRVGEWTELPACPATIILEGVTAQRGLARDGEALRGRWDEWMAAEDLYVAADDPVARANVVE